MSIIEILGGAVVGSTLTLAAGAFLSKTLVNLWVAKDLERHREDLRKAAIEHEVRFRRIDEKQAAVISEIYARLYRVCNAVSSLVAIAEYAGEPSKEEKLKAVSRRHEAFGKYFYPNRLYLPCSVADQTADLFNRVTEIAREFNYSYQREQQGRGAHDPQYWTEAIGEMNRKATPLFRQLEAIFREILGIKDADATGATRRQDFVGPKLSRPDPPSRQIRKRSASPGAESD